MLSAQPELELQLLEARGDAANRDKRETAKSPEELSALGGFGDEKHEVVVKNDLRVAIEVKQGTAWRVLYPEEELSIRFETPLPEVTVRFREEHDICHSCNVVGISLLQVSKAFTDFGPAAVEFIEAEQKEVKHEGQLQEERLQNVWRVILADRRFYYCLCLGCMPLPFLSLVRFTVAQPENHRAASLLSLGALLSFWLVINCLGALRHVVQTHAALEAKRQDAIAARTRDCCNCSYILCEKVLDIIFVLASAFLVAMIVLHCIRGFPWAALFLVLPLLFCFIFLYVSGVSAKRKEEIVAIFEQQLAMKTIVFEGKVQGCGPCVCSWPGIYESAWDVLVQSSREGDLSAAVVFLPEGSRLFGVHDPIPLAEALEGDCWCIPLYGEKKPWGCRWWTLWVQNIEEAVQHGHELMVYFFEKKQGQGKVQSFASAGKEHKRRESILSRKQEFEETEQFKTALEAGLKKLSQDKRGDSSSQYTREKQRLFLAWLPQEDHKFLEMSEGLGNSQKAEVAWLERKGYAYTAVEVDVAKWQYGPRRRLW